MVEIDGQAVRRERIDEGAFAGREKQRLEINFFKTEGIHEYWLGYELRSEFVTGGTVVEKRR